MRTLLDSHGSERDAESVFVYCHRIPSWCASIAGKLREFGSEVRSTSTRYTFDIRSRRDIEVGLIFVYRILISSDASNCDEDDQNRS